MPVDPTVTMIDQALRMGTLYAFEAVIQASIWGAVFFVGYLIVSGWKR